jgi:hypothetical protein
MSGECGGACRRSVLGLLGSLRYKVALFRTRSARKTATGKSHDATAEWYLLLELQLLRDYSDIK